jgi:hypothetical protein
VEPCSGVAETVKFACCPAVIIALGGAAETLKSGEQLAAVTDARVEQRSSRPWFSPRLGSSGTAFATAAAAPDWLMAAFRLCNNAAPPDTNGALNEVPHPAAYVLYGYVLTIASPGAATHTMSFPKLENDERVSWSVVDATPITSICRAAG